MVSEGLQGAGIWFDGVVRNPSRVLMELLNWAKTNGGAAYNYNEATGVVSNAGRLTGVVVRDAHSGVESVVRTSRVAICTGSLQPAPQGLIPPDYEDSDPRQFSFNLLLDKELPSTFAVAVDPKRGRGQLFFLVPMGSVTIAGTSHHPVRGRAPSVPSREQVEGILHQLNLALPHWGLVAEDITRVLGGVVPQKDVADRIDDCANSPLPPGYARVLSAKYTTAPNTGEEVLRRLFGKEILRSRRALRPSATRILSPPEFLALHKSDPAAAGNWVEGIWKREQVRGVEDFMLRRMDWGIHPDFLPEVQEVLDKMAGSRRGAPPLPGEGLEQRS